MTSEKKNDKKITVEQTVKANLCTGCGTCDVVCPRGAIRIRKNDKKGIYLAEVDADSCVHCGLCYRTCPGHTVDFEKLNQELFPSKPVHPLLGHYSKCYCGYTNDEPLRRNSSSGGLVPQFLIHALETGVVDGVLTTRMCKSNPFEPESYIARTREEILQGIGSKYCPVAANIGLREILSAPAGERFAFVGLPCHVHGLRMAQRISSPLKEKVVLCVAIFCAKTLTFCGTDYVMRKQRIDPGRVTSLSYRGNGWPGGMTVSLKDEKDLLIPMDEFYDAGFSSFSAFRCTLCSDHAGELSDISFGDAWLPELKSDSLGRSMVIVRNALSESIVQEMVTQGEVNMVEVDEKKVSQSQSEFCHKKRRLSARMRLVKLFGMQTPVFTQKLFPPKPIEYLMSAREYAWRFVASKRALWPLLGIRTGLLKMRRYMKK